MSRIFSSLEREQARLAGGSTTASGWWSNVTTALVRPRSRADLEGAADDGAVAGVHAVEGADGQRARAHGQRARGR